MVIPIKDQKQKDFFSKPDSLVELFFFKKKLKHELCCTAEQLILVMS